MLGGPFKAFLSHLSLIQGLYEPAESPIRTALVTARSAPAHERVIRTLRAWNVRIDEALFLGGLDKTDFLHSFGADIFLMINKVTAKVLHDGLRQGMCHMVLRIHKKNARGGPGRKFQCSWRLTRFMIPNW